MDKYIEIWRPVIETFERDYPHVARKLVDWYPIGRNEIVIKIESGDRFVYRYIGSSLSKIDDTDIDGEELDESAWRNKFSERLCKKMREVGVERWRLSQLTGISEVSISRYMNGKATPSAFNLERIAIALKCSSSELRVN